MFNNPYYNSQASVDRINNQIAELEKMRNQLQQVQPTNLTQNFQIAPSNASIRYADSLEKVEKEFVTADTPFFSKDWSDTYGELAYFSSLDGYMTDNVEFVEDYLDDRYPRECHYSKTVGEFAKEHPFGKYAVTMPNHITAILDGVIVDTFDPSRKVMRCAWKIK